MSDRGDTLARSTDVQHPSGYRVPTPLLVPSFSSKGFRITQEHSEVREAMEMTSEWLTDVALISAYDMHYGHIPRPEELDATPELFIVDSGGYEMRVEHDMSTAVHWPHSPSEWGLELLAGQYDAWPERFAAVFVSFDEPATRVPVDEQITAAKTLLGKYPQQLHTFLLKPETHDQKYLTKAIDGYGGVASAADDFAFIGVTEKELGPSMLDRMHAVARLRLLLDDGGVSAPIHVFGSLDPLTCLLYFIAGAEVFDGLTWLRYAYRRGLCLYQANYGALEVPLHSRDSYVRARILTDNVHELGKLAGQMRSFTVERNFAKFEGHAEFIENAFDALRARLKGAR